MSRIKRNLKLLFLIIIGITLTGCNSKYQGYWCNYEESATIVMILNDTISDTEKNAIEATASEFTNLKTITFYSKEDYAQEIGGDAEELEVHPAYVLSFSTNDSIGDYIESLGNLSGVSEVTQESAKSNMTIYYLGKKNKYTYTDSDEATDSDLESGKYKIKDGVITFTPSDSSATTKLLYVKNNLLCKDADCTKIYAKTNSKCEVEDN